jgi:hypothetical protein
MSGIFLAPVYVKKPTPPAKRQRTAAAIINVLFFWNHGRGTSGSSAAW